MELKNSYKWQEECLAIWAENGCQGIVQAVTGAGKTMFAVKAADYLGQLYGERLWVAVVVPTRALMVQWNRILHSHFFAETGTQYIQFQVYVINSARYQLARQILKKLRNGMTVLLVADECHHYASPENRKIFEFVPHMNNLSACYFALGLSATVGDPHSKEILKPALGRIIFDYSYKRALRERVISYFRLVQIAVHFDKAEYEEYQELSERLKLLRRKLYACYPLLKKDSGAFFSILQSLAKETDSEISTLSKSFLHLSYQRKKLVCMAKNRVFCVRDLLREIDIRKKILIFSESIEQAELLFSLLRGEYDTKVGKYHSRAGKLANKNTLERFRDSEVLILITCKALDEGIDVPDAGIGIILSGTGMERQRLQRLGRILRKSDGKESACLYYLFVKGSMEEKSYVALASENFRVENREYMPSFL